MWVLENQQPLMNIQYVTKMLILIGWYVEILPCGYILDAHCNDDVVIHYNNNNVHYWTVNDQYFENNRTQ